MNGITAFGAAILVTLASIGAGAAILAVLGVIGRLDQLAATAWSLALGIGILGWLGFFVALAGALDWLSLLVILSLLACGAVFLRRAAPGSPAPPRDLAWWVLWAFIAAILSLDLIEALSPPADGDSLAYHFALPKQFLSAGHLEFVPRAVDGAVPLLLHMTYTFALGLGGELGLTLWAGVSSWAGALLLYTIARDRMPRSAALAAVALYASVPAVIYSGGSGQVESRLALFGIAAAFSVANAVETTSWRHTVIAGMAAGFFAGAKYSGLLFGVAAALPFLVNRRTLPLLIVYGMVALVAGGQWYGWNAYHTGDPVFPTLYTKIGLADGSYWTAAQDAIFRSAFYRSETAMPATIWNAVVYPFIATLAPPPLIEAGRTGFGPFGLLVLPFVLMGLFLGHPKTQCRTLWTVAAVALAFYALWWGIGFSQRIRHLLPIYPLFVVCAMAAAVGCRQAVRLRLPLIAVIALSLAVHLGVAAVFGLGQARYVFSGESRDAYYRRTVPHYGFIAPTEAEVTPGGKVLTSIRHLIYLFSVPVFYYHLEDQAQVRFEATAVAPSRLYLQLRQLGITHVLALIPAPDDRPVPDTRPFAGMERLAQSGCATRLREIKAEAFGSRTLQALDRSTVRARLYRVEEQACRS